MGIRYRKRLKLAPGLRLNTSLSGFGLSAGPRGASLSFGRRGVFANLGIPGSGISTRLAVGGPDRAAAQTARERVRDQQREAVTLEAERINEALDRVLNLHLLTPPPSTRLTFQPYSFDTPTPQRQKARSIHLLARLFPRWRVRIEELNQKQEAEHERALHEWTRAREEHDRDQQEQRALFETRRLEDPEVMQTFLAEALTAIEWPRETEVSFEVSADGRSVLLDVDLPEIEDMPMTTAAASAAGLKLKVRERSATQVRKDYMTHVHAVAFRLVGVTFVVLPTTHTVIVSGYSQRTNKATGHVQDEYLFSARIRRPEWESLNFNSLGDLDVPACLGQFELRRKMTSTGIFTPVQPFSSASGD